MSRKAGTFLAITLLFCQSASGEEFRQENKNRGISEAVSNEPELLKAADPILVAWALMQDRFAYLKTVDTDKTIDKKISKLVLYNPKPGQTPPEQVKTLQAATIANIEKPYPAPTKICTGQPIDVSNCCAESVNPDCLLRIRWEEAPTEAGQGMLKYGFYLYSLMDFGRELAKSSILVKLADIPGGIFPGGKLLFVWPYYVGSDKSKILVTQVDDVVVSRMTTTFGYLLPRFRQALGSPAVGMDAFACSASGFNPALWGSAPTGSLLAVSPGSPIEVTHPPGVGDYFATVELNSRPGVTLVRFANKNTPPITGGNSPLISYVDSIPTGAEYYPCLGNGATDAIRQGRNLLNAPASSVWFFQSIFLQAVLSEFLATKPSFAADLLSPAPSVSNSLSAQLSSIPEETVDFGQVAASEGPNCRSECDAASPLCLPVTYLGEKRLSQLQKLQQELLRRQPFEITPSRLGQIFDMTSDPSVGLRGTTYVDKDKLINEGKPSTIQAGDNSNRMLWLHVPEILSGNIRKKSSDAYSVDFTGELALLQISDRVINDQYGGRVTNIVTSKDDAIVGTENGCFQLLFKPPSPVEQVTRLIKMFGQGKDRRSASSLLRLLTISDDDPKEKPCLKVSAGYGGMCPPADCPPYNFKCGDQCVIVIGLGANKYAEAKMRAETASGKTCN
ncbi:hypothetical protein [Methylocystis echinoides]|uniref:hypothetical protein n=1 Tax=Methylocystis echinoides TaxID=29468 RepID=UPI003441B387